MSKILYLSIDCKNIKADLAQKVEEIKKKSPFFIILSLINDNGNFNINFNELLNNYQINKKRYFEETSKVFFKKTKIKMILYKIKNNKNNINNTNNTVTKITYKEDNKIFLPITINNKKYIFINIYNKLNDLNKEINLDKEYKENDIIFLEIYFKNNISLDNLLNYKIKLYK
jgi:hypothetical protein